MANRRARYPRGSLETETTSRPLRRESRNPQVQTIQATPSTPRRKPRRRLYYPGSEYEAKRQFYETYYPGTQIRDMPYRVPGWGKRGPNWEKMHGRLVKFRQRSRYGG